VETQLKKRKKGKKEKKKMGTSQKEKYFKGKKLGGLLGVGACVEGTKIGVLLSGKETFAAK